MKLRNKKLIIYLSAILVLTLSACVLRTVALVRDFGLTSGYFIAKELIYAATAVISVTAVGGIAYAFLDKSTKDLSPDFHGAPTYISSGLLGLALLFFAGNAAVNGGLFSPLVKGSGKLLLFILILSALASAVYLFLNVFLGRRYSLLRGGFSFAPIIFLLACASVLYFDKTLPINAPNKSVDLLAYVAAMIFFTSEARLSLGREKWRAYVSLGIIGSALTAYASVPAILTYFATISEGRTVISASIFDSVLLFALFVFISARCATVAFLNSNKQGELAAHISAEGVKESADEAESEDGEEKEETEAVNENQISIDDIISDSESESESDK